MDLKLPVSQEILTEISKLDHFQGVWSAQQAIPAERLARIEEAVCIQSVGSSCRLAGIRVTDAEVAGLLRGESTTTRDAKDVLGYARGLGHPLPGSEQLLTSEAIRELHSLMLGTGEEPSPWRHGSLHREAFNADGKAIGRVFPTLPHRMVEQKTEEALTWLEYELRSGEQHAVLVVGTFLLCFLSIAPFEKGNGRIVRVLSNHLLRRVGYGAIPYASLESQMEELRDEYHSAVDLAQTRLWAGEADLEPWMNFFLRVLGRHRVRVEAKMELERQVRDYPPLQRSILETIREHGSVDAALLLKATGANRNTLKDNLRRLVHRGVLEKTGQRRGTRYRLAAADQNGMMASRTLET